MFNTLIARMAVFVNMRKDNEKAKEANRVSYRQYRKSAFHMWYETLPGTILNQKFYVVAVRMFIASFAFVYVAYATIFRGCNWFGGDIVYNFMMFTSSALCVCAFVNFGARSSYTVLATVGIPVAAYYVNMGFSLVLNRTLQPVYSYSMLAVFYGLYFFLVLYLYHSELYYTDIKVYVRKDHIIAMDLFLSDFSPIYSLDSLVKIRLSNEKKRKNDRKFYSLLRFCSARARNFGGVWCGYVSDMEAEVFDFYFYMPSGKSNFENKLADKISRFGYRVENISMQNDPSWNAYEQFLYPTVTERCEISARECIEKLFFRGVKLDREHVLKFRVYFKNFRDLAEFEDSISYYGFRLSYSCCGCTDRRTRKDGFNFVGCYELKTYVTPRRIEYLNSILIKKAEEEGACYLGEWNLRMKSRNYTYYI